MPWMQVSLSNSSPCALSPTPNVQIHAATCIPVLDWRVVCLTCAADCTAACVPYSLPGLPTMHEGDKPTATQHQPQCWWSGWVRSCWHGWILDLESRQFSWTHAWQRPFAQVHLGKKKEAARVARAGGCMLHARLVCKRLHSALVPWGRNSNASACFMLDRGGCGAPWSPHFKHGGACSHLAKRGLPSHHHAAGGDVKAARARVLESPYDDAPPPGHAIHAMFQAEYSAVTLIGSYPLPIISWATGIWMGLGVGLAAFGRYRVVSDSTVFAMPENVIGEFCFLCVGRGMGHACTAGVS